MLLVSCIADDPSATTDGFQDLMLVALSGYRAFPRINGVPFSSTAGAFDVNVEVSQAAASYTSIHPDASGSHVTMPRTAMIVREVLDASGAVHKLTIMAKGPPGASPALGDWWFAQTTPDGIPLLIGGEVQIGPMPECQSCHLMRAQDDYLFGVAAADQ